MGKNNRKRHLSCQNCDECQYIGEGDYACMKDMPKVVLTEFGTPTEDYMWCRKEKKNMHLIKVRFLNNGAPAGKAYTYYSPVNVAVGDTVQINSAATGIVVEVDVPDWQVEPYKEKIKTIVGLVDNEKKIYSVEEKECFFNILRGITVSSYIEAYKKDELIEFIDYIEEEITDAK